MNHAPIRLFAVAGVIALTFVGCRCSCSAGTTSSNDPMDQTPECQEVRKKHEACLSMPFDVKWSCGPNEGECIASARARLKCSLAIPGNYDCKKTESSSSMTPMIPAKCREFEDLCTGKDPETTIQKPASSGK